VKGAGTKEESRPAKLMIQEWKDKKYRPAIEFFDK
jgi:hypothetical protein